MIRALADLLRIVASASPTPCVRARACELRVCARNAIEYACVVCAAAPALPLPPPPTRSFRQGWWWWWRWCAVGYAQRRVKGSELRTRCARTSRHSPLWEGRTRFHVSPPALSRSGSFRLRRSPPVRHTTAAFAAQIISAPPLATELVRHLVVDDDDHSLTSKLFGIFSV